MRQFSQGMVYAVPQGANPTPIPFGLLGGSDVEINQDKVALRGQYKAPVDFGDGNLDVKLKTDFMDIRASTLAAVISGTSTATGSKILSPGESFTIPTTPFQVTVAQGATFSENAGVWDVTAQKWLDVVASAPATGQYSFSGAGVYTFAAADVAHVVVIYYVFTSASIGKTVTVPNIIMGPSTSFLVRVYNIYTSGGVTKPFGLELPQVHFPKLTLSGKIANWMQHNIEGQCSADVGQNLVKAYLGD